MQSTQGLLDIASAFPLLKIIQPSQRRIIRSQGKLSAEEIIMEVFNGTDDSQQFFTGNTLVALRLGKRTAEVFYDVFLSIMLLA